MTFGVIIGFAEGAAVGCFIALRPESQGSVVALTLLGAALGAFIGSGVYRAIVYEGMTIVLTRRHIKTLNALSLGDAFVMRDWLVLVRAGTGDVCRITLFLSFVLHAVDTGVLYRWLCWRRDRSDCKSFTGVEPWCFPSNVAIADHCTSFADRRRNV
jgi:hypothetical protein